MIALITEDPENWTIVVKDQTARQSFTVSTPYSSAYATAKGITENG